MADRLVLILKWKNRETKNKHLEDLYSTLFKVSYNISFSFAFGINTNPQHFLTAVISSVMNV